MPRSRAQKLIPSTGTRSRLRTNAATAMTTKTSASVAESCTASPQPPSFRSNSRTNPLVSAFASSALAMNHRRAALPSPLAQVNETTTSYSRDLADLTYLLFGPLIMSTKN